ncbi:unnamed protein product, partial [Pylaiella littoralis]
VHPASRACFCVSVLSDAFRMMNSLSTVTSSSSLNSYLSQRLTRTANDLKNEKLTRYMFILCGTCHFVADRAGLKLNTLPLTRTHTHCRILQRRGQENILWIVGRPDQGKAPRKAHDRGSP